jgi:hypothetical protein
MSTFHNFTAAFVCLALVGCATEVKRGEAPQARNEGQDIQEHTWTAGIIDRPQPDSRPARLIAVRTATHDGFDRTVFEFDKRLPGYHTEYIDQPVRKCGSGKVAQLAGDGWLEVRLYPARAHTEEGEPTVLERERMLDMTVLSELEQTCDFEAVVTWVLGVQSPNRYRVRELSSPPRLVIDVRH